MMLNDLRIMSAIESGAIVISPYSADQVNPNSVDLRVGMHYARMTEWSSAWEIHRFRGEGIELQPGEHILLHSEEFAGTNVQPGCTTAYVPQLSAKSTSARRGLNCIMGAGLGDVGFVNRWTFAVQNCIAVPVAIRPGDRLVQLVFHDTQVPAQIYGRDVGHYQSNQDLDTLILSWRPQMMIAKGEKWHDYTQYVGDRDTSGNLRPAVDQGVAPGKPR
jgi:dCTP deaminase